MKRSILVEAEGGPLAVVIAGANVPDAQLLEETNEAVVLERPPVEDGWGVCIDHEYDPRIALIRDERPKTHEPRRWVVKRTLTWLSKCRAILVRVLLWFRRLHRLTATWIVSLYVARCVRVSRSRNFRKSPTFPSDSFRFTPHHCRRTKPAIQDSTGAEHPIRR